MPLPDRHLDLRALALRPGESTERIYSLELGPFALGGQEYQLVPRGEGVALEVERIAGGFLVSVALRAMVYGACYRCLREVAVEVDVREQEFVPVRGEAWDEADMSPFIVDLVVDVPALAREAVILGLPEKILCEESCRGLCPECGGDLNQDTCSCAPTAADPRWQKLRGLDPGRGPGAEQGAGEE